MFSLESGAFVVEDPIVDKVRVASPLEASTVTKSGSLTDEALRDEASKYVGLPSSSGLISEIEGEEQLPLSIILADGSNGEMGPEGERSSGGEGRGDEFEILLQDLEGRGCRWMIVAWRDLASFWVFRRKDLKEKY